MIKYTLLIIWLIYTLLFLATHLYITPRLIKSLLELLGCCIEKKLLDVKVALLKLWLEMRTGKKFEDIMREYEMNEMKEEEEKC